MKISWFAPLLAVGWTASLHAQTAPAAAVVGPVTAEYYYRIKWGSAQEFKRLYERNHAPIMREMQKQGFITSMEIEEPFTHLAGGPRWDLRVTVTFREAASAIVIGSPFDKAFVEAQKRLYPNKAVFDAEEARRFSLLEDHWDMIITPVGE
jgi:hypothetical protein